MPDLKYIKYEYVRGWARVTLMEGKKHNALSYELLCELEEVLWEADEDRDVHAVLLCGDGPSFSAGYDLLARPRPSERHREGATNFRGARSIDDDIWRMEASQRAIMTVFDMHKPVVAQVHGNCIAGGLDLALLADMVIAADDAVIGFPPVRKMGTPPQNMWLYHVPAQWAKRLLLTGDVLTGKDAAKIGLVLESWPLAELKGECEALMDRLALIDPDILAANKRSVNLAMELMGARTLQRIAVELDARAHKSAGAIEFGREMKELGLKGALERRDEGFGDPYVRVRGR